MDTKNSTAPVAHPSTESEAGPCACLDGWVWIGQMVEGEDGEEVEEYAMYLCRRCHGS